MSLIVSRKSWALAPALAVISLAALGAAWAAMDPASLRSAFDADGRSYFELLTLQTYILIVPAVWLLCPFGGSARRKALLSLAVTSVAVMAVLKETDLHVAILSAAYPDAVAGFRGTPFKLRFLCTSGVPLGAKAMVAAYFSLFFGVFAAMFAAYSIRFVKGVLRLHPVAWTVGCLGASGLMVQICDRLPSWWRHSKAIAKSELADSFLSFCTAFEEGGEMMIALFALLAIAQAHAIYAPDRAPEEFSI